MPRPSPAAAAFPIALGLGLALLGAPAPTARGDEGAPPALDYAWYKDKVAPILHGMCGECHADPRQRRKMGRFFLRPAPGRRIRERYHERNFETVAGFVEPGNPAASLLLLKAIGPARGGVTHEGGALIGDNTPEYGALVDFINGARGPRDTFEPPASEPGQPDFLFFYKRIEPVLLGVCAECHAGRGKGRHKLITHERGEPFPLEDHYENFQTILQLVVPGSPERSRFLTKPLAVAEGGIKHRGGDVIRKDTPNYENWVAFIRGEKGPPLPTDGPRPVPTLTAEGLVLQAEELRLEGGVEDVERKGAQEFYVVEAGELGGKAHARLQVLDAGAYKLAFRLVPGEAPMRWGFGGEAGRELDPSWPPEADEDGYVEVGPETLLDGAAPLTGASGDLWLEGEVLHMDGRQVPAAWLSPSDVRHTGVSARLAPAHEEEGGDDALLLFDMQDAENGKFVGLADGGRRLVIGVLEGGVTRALATAKAPPPAKDRAGGPREVKVETFAGVAVGSLDGTPLVFAHLDKHLGRGRFGVMTHGILDVHAVAALEEYEVYAVRLRTGPVVRLPLGVVDLWIELPPGSGALDSVRLSPSGG